MDGQRRFHRPVGWVKAQRLLRRFLARRPTLKMRAAARASAVVFLGLAIVGGLVRGGHLESREGNLGAGDRFASAIGFAADDISISGLENHEPEQLLRVLGVSPGSSLVGFDTGTAKRLLEGIDWVEQASVQRKFPNQLEISVVERQPFAVWQRGGSRYVIDRHGAAMSGIEPSRAAQLPLVSGEGANLAAASLINVLEASPDLLVRVDAAARVGKRRWTLFLDNGVRVLLPETGEAAALQTLVAFDRQHALLSKGILEVDLRVPERLGVSLAQTEEEPVGNEKERSLQ